MVKKLTGELFIKKGQIKPDYSSGVRLEAQDIYELLPGINCKVCDELTCLAFAEKLLSKERNIVRCALRFTPEYKEKRQVLGELLWAAGYSLPGIRE